MAFDLAKALFRLFCADREAAANLEAADDLREEVVTTEAEFRKRRRLVEEVEAQKQQAETELREVQNEHFSLSSNLEQRKPEIANCRKQAAHWTIKEREAQAKIQQEQEKMKTLEA
ncbi:unnamed protein product [Effrenium voratum]|nr:unnamed protein product [Effrenium voratum]